MQDLNDLYDSDLNALNETYEPVHWFLVALLGAVLMFGLMA
jgi:hypothetical protein